MEKLDSILEHLTVPATSFSAYSSRPTSMFGAILCGTTTPCLCRQTSIQQKLSTDLEKSIDPAMIATSLIIINMDETPLSYDMLRSSRITKKGATQVHIQGTKSKHLLTAHSNCVMKSF